MSCTVGEHNPLHGPASGTSGTLGGVNSKSAICNELPDGATVPRFLILSLVRIFQVYKMVKQHRVSKSHPCTSQRCSIMRLMRLNMLEPNGLKKAWRWRGQVQSRKRSCRNRPNPSKRIQTPSPRLWSFCICSYVLWLILIVRKSATTSLDCKRSQSWRVLKELVHGRHVPSWPSATRIPAVLRYIYIMHLSCSITTSYHI